MGTNDQGRLTGAGKRKLAKELLDRWGGTFADELGIKVRRNTPGPLFELLVFSLLSGARISHNAAMQAAKALFKQGWTTPRKMAQSTWRQRTDTLNRNGYARYDESTSRYLGETCTLLLDKYGGDLRMLRKQADHDPARMRQLLKEFKGVGDVTADIFLREAQVAWDELYPLIDGVSAKAAARLGLGDSAQELAKLVDRDQFASLVAALVRVQLEGKCNQLMAA